MAVGRVVLSSACGILVGLLASASLASGRRHHREDTLHLTRASSSTTGLDDATATLIAELTLPLLSEADRLRAVRKAAPEIAAQLPLRFEDGLSNPCFREANGSHALRCLPAFFISGAMQCASSDLWKRLQQHGHVPSTHDALSHWWTNHPRSRAGDFGKYLDRLSGPRTLKALQREPSSLLGEASPATFSYVMAESLRLHYLYLDAFAECHGKCRSKHPPARYAEDCKQKSYDFRHCYDEANAAAVPEGFNIPSLVLTTYGVARPPKLITLLREPSVRLWVAYWTYGQYPAKYGDSPTGFGHYVSNQTATFHRCAQTEYHQGRGGPRGRRRCSLRFEGYGNAEAEVYYHCDQILKGMYAAFLPEWQAALPPRHLLVLRTEDYLLKPMRALRQVSRHLGLRPMSENEARKAERLKSSDELKAVVKRGHPLPETSKEREAVLGPIRRFYEPFNQALSGMLHNDAFLWRDFESLYPLQQAR